MTDEWWIRKDLEGSGLVLIEAFYNFPTCTKENLCQDTGVLAEIWTENLPNESSNQTARFILFFILFLNLDTNFVHVAKVGCWI
jgi:hypothetical protein